MKYLCLGYHEERAWNSLSPEERDDLLAECIAYSDVLRKNGHCIDCQALQPASTAATIRFESGKALITDGPFAETKEQLGGIMVLEASDLNHAIQLMSQNPCRRLGGSMEIRPLNEVINHAVEGKK